MKRNWWVIVLIAMMAVLGGCKSGGSKQNSTDARFLNAVADAEPLDFLVDDDVKVSGIGLGTLSSYANFDSGTHDVKFRSKTIGTTLLDKSIGFTSGAKNTVVALGKRASMASLVLVDDTPNPTSGHWKLRATGLSPDVGAVDLYVTTGTDISSTAATIATIGFSSVTDYVELTPGSFVFTLAAAGTKDVLFQSAAQALADGNTVTFAVFPSSGAKLVNGFLIQNGGAGTLLTNPLARLKAVNAVPDSTALNFKSNGSTLLSNVPYTGSSSYVTTSAGARTLTIENAAVPGTAIATLTTNLDAARDYTMLAVNNLAQVQLALLSDDNTLPGTGFAKIRFVNAQVGSTSVDVLVNFASQASGIAFKTASGYYQLAAATDYNISFTTPGGVTVIATLSPAQLDANAIYTAYLFGTPSAPTVKLVRDR